ncbi:MAG: hypothetical protein HY660_11030 [Armatimonadetes bacterium]|nr:hypothetical protein [Armatimonadota bacterium]
MLKHRFLTLLRTLTLLLAPAFPTLAQDATTGGKPSDAGGPNPGPLGLEGGD